jgi:hypothetical protein
MRNYAIGQSCNAPMDFGRSKRFRLWAGPEPGRVPRSETVGALAVETASNSRGQDLSYIEEKYPGELLIKAVLTT